MEKVIFLDDCQVEAQGEIVQKFTKGKVYDLAPESAARWVRRGKAKRFTGLPDVPPKKAAAKAKPKGRPKKAAAKSKPLATYDLPGSVDRSKILNRENGVE